MGVAMNTVGVDTSLTRFSPASAPSSNSRSTIAQLYGVDTHAAHGSRAIGWKMVALLHAAVACVRRQHRHAAACVAIYRPYVQPTVISWGIDIPTVADMAARIDGLRATHEWLVLERDGQIVGFAHGQPLKLPRRLTERVTTQRAQQHLSSILGLRDAGSYRRVAWMQLDLLNTAGPDGPPGPIRWPGPAPSGPLRNRQGAMSARTDFARVNRGRVVHLRC